MKENIIPADKNLAQWAAKKDFDEMALVDPAFRRENLGRFRHWLLRQFVFPTRYDRALQGYVVEIDDKPQAYLFLESRGKSSSIEAIGVDKSFRRQGIGSRLIEKAEEISLEKEQTALSVNMAAENLIGQAFCEAMGFRPYRQYGYQFRDRHILDDLKVDDGLEIEKLTVVDNHDVYEKWLTHELENGDSWIKDVIQEDFYDLGLLSPATSWRCLLNGEEVGFLRLSNAPDKGRFYFSCDSSLWGEKSQLGWVKLALEESPLPLLTYTLKVGSGIHHETSKSVWESAGMEEELWARYLLFKVL
ncbi:MAG: GNAT family N-acetyltransferase [Anaerolineales bacterium]|nr:GNAT family N-acetyltransferase [Anaerolineales bacterium]